MGGGSSKEGKRGLLGNKKSKKGTSDDGCIGNEKIRTVILSGLIIAFAGFAISLILDLRKPWYDINNISTTLCQNTGGCKGYLNGYTTSWVGLILFIVGGIAGIIVTFMDNETIKKISGVILVVAGICYLVGTSWVIGTFRNTILYVGNSNQDAQLAAQFGEAMLPSIAAILLGLDLWIHFMQDEWKRLLCNLLNICIVSGLCEAVYYTWADSDLTTSDSFACIAVGYTILFVVSLVYIILWLFQCCTCDCKDTACIRIIVAVGLIIGGVLTSIGYYILASDVYRSEQYVLFYIGLTIFVGGYSCVWALDIAFDDIKSKSR
mmetsp:Transcript_1078/g.1429  ORF Transcript_1078/g.1429 Transcript_1078/m.1429 type:complete len:321 (-) Transcript_1078:56-1018(-)